jgi:membrane protein
MPDLVSRFDGLQRRRRAVGFPLAVVYKFFDDQGNYLAAVITYYAFIAIFPLMLIASSVLGFVLQGDPGLERRLLNSALSQFPIVGTQLGRPEGLHGSGSAVVLGTLAALYGVLGLGQAAQNALNTTWAIPRNSRLNPIHSRLLSFILLAVGGLSVLTVAVVSGFAGRLDLGPPFQVLTWLISLAAVALTALLLAVMMSWATSERHRLRTVLPGSVVIAVLWQLLQVAGGAYVAHVVNKASQMNGVFALVLGLVAFIYLAAVIGVLGFEINAVAHKVLYPRALLTPFTDDVQLTDADRRVYTEYARSQRHKGFERVEVTFEPTTPQTETSGT